MVCKCAYVYTQNALKKKVLLIIFILECDILGISK